MDGCNNVLHANICIKPGLHISRKDRKHMVANTFFKPFMLCLGLYIVVMISGIHISQEIFAIDVLTTLTSSPLEQRRKHVLRSLRGLCGDQALTT